MANIATNLKAGERNDLEFCVHLLENSYGADVHVLHEENYLKALFFSTKEMRQALNAWPEFVALDGTYKLLNNDLTVYIFLVEDAGGNSEIAGVGLLASEDRDSIYWLLNTFKTQNSSTDSIKCFMTDKDLLQRSAIKEVFPDVETYICLFHTLKTFNREVSCQKLNITQSERITSLELLTKLVYSPTNEDYDQIYKLFSQQVPLTVLTYFNKNWHQINSEWTVCNMKNGNLNNRTNNRLESINNKIKQVVAKNSSFSSFIKSFFNWLNSFHNERNNRLVKEFLKANVSIFKPGSIEDQYSKLLTKYSYDYILKNLTNSKHISLKQKNNIFEARHNNEVITVDENHCTCANFSSMFLPCKHIFAVKQYLNKSLFCPELCHKRWTKDYYFRNNRYFLNQSNDLSVTAVYSNKSSSTKKVLSGSQKRSKATDLCNKIVSDLIQSSTSQFLYRLDILKRIERLWRNGDEVAVQQVSADDILENRNTDIGHVTEIVETLENEEPGVNIIENNDNRIFEHKERTWQLGLRDKYNLATDEEQNSLHDDRNVNFTTDIGTIYDRNKMIITNEKIETVVSLENGYDYTVQSLDSHSKDEVIYVHEIVDNLYRTNDCKINTSKEIQESGGYCLEAKEIKTDDKDLNTAKINVLSNIKIPTKFKKRGRPSGADTTVVGLKKKKMKNVPIRFEEKSYTAQLENALGNLIQQELIPRVLNKSHTITESDFKHEIGHPVMSDEIDLEILGDYMTEQALQKIKQLKEIYIWNCSFCKKTLASDPNIMCDCCLFWYHFSCVGLCRAPKTKSWFCRNCF